MHIKNKIFISFIVYSYAYAIEIPPTFGINFYDSMSCVKQNIPFITSNKDWQAAIKPYNSYISNPLYAQGPVRIPKIIHQIWLGSPLPERYKALQETWIKHNPGWEFKLWTDKDIEAFGLRNKDQYDASKNWGQKSDIARYEILFRYGGLYVDVDFECLKPFNILHHCCDFYTGVTYGPNFALYNGLIGVRAGHPMMKACIEKINIHKKYHKDPIVNILFTSGPYFFTGIYKKYMYSAHDASIAFPVGYFYPWPNTYRHENERHQIEKWFRPETMAVHHWTVSWNGGVAPGQSKNIPGFIY